MNNEIDLSKFNIRCDLISETLENNLYKNIKIKRKNYEKIKVEKITIKKIDEEVINKKSGNYITIYFEDATDVSNRKKLIDVLSKELKSITKKYKKENSPVLVVGLGNILSTPDSLGPKVASKIVVTRHLFNIEGITPSDNVNNVASFSPGVFASTGIESSDVLKGIVDIIKPGFVLVVDALASSSMDNVNKVIQITDAGIEPGSGVGNNRTGISQETLNVPVIAVGIPTVVDAVTIVGDTLKYLMKKISYNIKNINKEKLVVGESKSFKNINYNLDNDEKKKYFGLLGELEESELKELFGEVLCPIGYNFMVTPKEIDFEIEKLSFVLAKSINNVLHN